MSMITKINAASCTILFAGTVVVAAGASVPSEQTMALGFFIMLCAMAVLIGINWPKHRAPRLTPNLISLAAYRIAHRRRH
ncbi:hypothetical protein [Sphingomonas abietis]|uniref:Uncharacterized protein n=1 Tax=Sphingomonas abietis TaxID=3012344 RepID=A0ABY7NMV1_9SPHN|nr:hypothetical protein [Sphingomonas abietis]WBO22155.1 hypothetical protein PBT88_18700 [Sphingomonas abietis]